MSPKSGRAVSREAGEPYAGRLLRLPAFLREADMMADARGLADGFALTGFFLERYVLEPRGLLLGDERAHFIAALNRDRGITVLMVTHEPDMAAYARRVVHFVDGRVARDERRAPQPQA